MKRYLIAFAVSAALVGGYLAAAHLSGGALPTPGLALGGDVGQLRRQTLAFWEDIQFKDFDAAASYHSPDARDDVDIPFLIERAFVMKPEVLEILEYEVVLADVDSTGDRARVKTRVKVKNLLTGDLAEREIQLFWHRADPAAPWFMELESSLRPPKSDNKR